MEHVLFARWDVRSALYSGLARHLTLKERCQCIELISFAVEWVDRCWPHEHCLRILDTFYPRWQFACPLNWCCVTWVDELATPKYHPSHDDAGAQMLPHCVYVQRPRSELNTWNSFHDVIRLQTVRQSARSALVWYQCQSRGDSSWSIAVTLHKEDWQTSISWVFSESVFEFSAAVQLEIEVLPAAKVPLLLVQCLFANPPTVSFSCRVFVSSKAAFPKRPFSTRPNRQMRPQIHFLRHGHST